MFTSTMNHSTAFLCIQPSASNSSIATSWHSATFARAALAVWRGCKNHQLDKTRWRQVAPAVAILKLVGIPTASERWGLAICDSCRRCEQSHDRPQKLKQTKWNCCTVRRSAAVRTFLLKSTTENGMSQVRELHEEIRFVCKFQFLWRLSR